MKQVLCLTIFSAALILAADTEPTAAVTGGQIRGRALGAGAVFQGVPYAEAPLGDLRWREPRPVKAWTGVRDATKYGATCAQIDARWNKKAADLGSEDCLFLNIWTADWPAKSGKPVMFWIHGGGNMGGSALGQGGIEPPFDGEALSKHSAVVVTINYRLGVLGYLAHPELSKESGHKGSGDYGLMDQIAALKWVRDNIAKFGGDPANVTIFGQSGGAQDVGLLMTSPLSKGLFQRVIEESGTMIGSGRTTKTLADAEKFGLKFAEQLKAPADGTFAYLRKLPVEEVLKASPPYGGGMIGPSIDNYVIPKSGAEVFASGQQHRVGLLIGTNAREHAFPGKPEELPKAIEEFYGPQFAPKALELYGFAGKPQAKVYEPWGDVGSQFITDTQLRCATVQQAEWQFNAKLPIYQYEFSHPFPESKRGAPHSGELRYVFGVLPGTPSESEKKISNDIETYWTNFARTGDPNGNGLPVWPKFDTQARRYMELTDNGPVAKETLRRDYCELFQEFVKARLAKK